MIAWTTIALTLWAAHAEPTQDDISAVQRCLSAQDVGCAEAVVERSGMAASSQGVPLAVAAEVAFSAADYPLAFQRITEAVAAGFDDTRDRLALYERTLFATAGWVEAPVGRFRVRYRPGLDEVLIDGAAEALERTDRFVTPLLGGPPPGATVVELYPDGRSFIAASSLAKEDVESTGVVAISKWTRLLVSSPRALGRGYDWQSTVSHEYIHLVVAHNTDDRAPVWLQEAIAKYLDGRFATGQTAFRLPVSSQSKLAAALADDGLVPFEEMHPSLAKIKVLTDSGEIDKAASASRAELAYAQLSSLMDYCFQTAGEDVLLTALPLVREGDDPRDALTQAVGAASFEALLEGWEVWIRAQDLISTRLAEMPTVLDGGSDSELDPVLSKRRDLANFLRLGDLLADRGRHRAALVEYDKARDDEDDNSPLLANRVAQSLVALGDPIQARGILLASSEEYPTYPLTWRTLGSLAASQGNAGSAINYLRRALSYDPFHVDAQQELQGLLRQVGAGDEAQEVERILQILRRGGEDNPPPPIHEMFGEYELPRAEIDVSELAGVPDPFTDHPAPQYAVETLDGERITSKSLDGRVVVLDFWATWCGPCRAVMPKLSELAAQYASEGLTVLSISNESTGIVRRFVASEAKQGNVFEQQMVLEDGGVRKAFRVSSIPKLVIIDRDGVVRLVHVGAGNFPLVQSTVERLLGVAPDEVTQ